MLGGEDHVGGAEEGVGAGGEDGDVIAFDIEGDLGSFRAADPVALEGFDGLWPVERLEFIDEALGVFRDAEHPLAERAAFDGFAFFLPFLDFLVG